jgi:hypothetical protein
MSFDSKIRDLLKKYKKGSAGIDDVIEELRDFPCKDIKFAKIDVHRKLRRGFPEVIFCPGKTDAQVLKIAEKMFVKDEPLLLTRARKTIYKRLKKKYGNIRFNDQAKLIYYIPKGMPKKTGLVSVICGGTSDIPVAEEARLTLEVMGNPTRALYDVGVAGLHRILKELDIINKSNVLVVVAGMEGALASVVSGLTAKPVVAVPTSVGYGASFSGIAPMLTMLNSCSPGVAVVNIDNGFGAGYYASIINR